MSAMHGTKKRMAATVSGLLPPRYATLAAALVSAKATAAMTASAMPSEGRKRGGTDTEESLYLLPQRIALQVTQLAEKSNNCPMDKAALQIVTE
jgi:hypothetical protein